MSEWTLAETNTHQDHVIAHVLGATVEGYFLRDETAYLLLDIGFIWNIFLDCTMGLMPHPVAISELDADQELKTRLQRDVDAIISGVGATADIQTLTVVSNRSPIQSVEIYEQEHARRLVLTCEVATLLVETSLESGEVKIHEN